VNLYTCWEINSFFVGKKTFVKNLESLGRGLSLSKPFLGWASTVLEVTHLAKEYGS